MALTTLPLIKQALNISLSDTSRDPQLSILLDMASQQIKDYCRREFEPQTYTEYYSGTDRRELVLRQRPVTSITNLWVDWFGAFGDNPSGSFPDASKLVFGTDYNLDWDGSWPVGSSTRVCYNGVVLRLNSIWQFRSRAYYPLQLSPDSQSSDGTIKVVYTAGYNPIPMDLQYATAYVVSYMKRVLPVGGDLEMEKIGEYMYKIHYPRYGQIPPELASARQVLNRYREVTL